jgi:hypothetical protein
MKGRYRLKQKETNMRKYLVAAMILTSLGSFGVIGCDRAKSEKTETVTSPDGASSTSKEKTVEHNDGSTTTEKTTKSTSP